MGLKEDQLTLILEEAAEETPGALHKFFEVLMKSRIFVPLKAEPQQGMPIVGQLESGGLGFLTVPGGDEEDILPFFSEEGFVGVWAEREMFYTDLEFRQLIWLIGEGTVLHLNPGQEIGREFSRWEIDQLRRGEGAIPEIVAEVEGGQEDELLLQPAGQSYDPLKKKLLAVLEVSEELAEGFLVIAQEENGADKPMLGLRYAEKISEERRKYFRDELEYCSQECLPPERRLTIIDDLDEADSPNWVMFEDINPFYVANVISDPGSERGSIAKDLWKRMGNFRTDDEEED